MSENPYQCTARRLATNNPETLDHDTPVAEAHKWFQGNGFDYAPVLENQDPVGYVGAATVAEESGKRVEDVMKTIKFQNIIASDTRFQDILTGLKEQFFYLLGGKNEVTGILTRADLNTSPARIHLFDRISLLEQDLRDLIEDIAPNWYDEVNLHPKRIDEIDRLQAKAEKANVELGKIHYAGFSTLGKVIKDYDKCWRACGYEEKHKAGSDLKKIRDLRNDVAHSNLILQTTSADYNTKGRSIWDLITIYDALTDCNKSLQSRTE